MQEHAPIILHRPEGRPVPQNPALLSLQTMNLPVRRNRSVDSPLCRSALKGELVYVGLLRRVFNGHADDMAVLDMPAGGFPRHVVRAMKVT